MPSPPHLEGPPLRTAEPADALLSDRLVPEAVAACRSVADKERLLSELAALMAAGTVPHMSAAAIEKELREREAVQTTAMGHGMAIPHATVAGLPQTIVGVMTLASPIPFGDDAEEPVDVCFCLLGPPSDRASHLRLLAAIAGAATESDLLERMRSAETTEDLLEALAGPGPRVVAH